MKLKPLLAVALPLLVGALLAALLLMPFIARQNVAAVLEDASSAPLLLRHPGLAALTAAEANPAYQVSYWKKTRTAEPSTWAAAVATCKPLSPLPPNCLSVILLDSIDALSAEVQTRQATFDQTAAQAPRSGHHRPGSTTAPR